MVNRKKYECTTCKTVKLVETSHFGEIYNPCKKCGQHNWFCIEDIALEHRSQLPQVKVQFYTYRFDLNNTHQLVQYKELEEKMSLLKYNKWDFYVDSMKNPFEYWRQYSNKEVTIYKPNTFDNQFISEIGRIHNWAEAIYPNKFIKEGYYILWNNE